MSGFNTFLAVFLIFNSIIFCNSKELPEGWNSCFRNDPQIFKCITKQGRAVLQTFCQGLPSYGVPVLDPLTLGKADIVSQSSSLQLKQYNATLRGLCGSKLIDVGVNPETKTGKLHVIFDAVLLTNVESKGRILVIPLDGRGDIGINITQTDIDLNFNYGLYDGKDNAKYVRILDSNYDFDFKTARFAFQELFGDNVLGEAVTNLANESPRDMVNELGKPILNVIIKRIIIIINKFFATIPYDILLPQ